MSNAIRREIIQLEARLRGRLIGRVHDLRLVARDNGVVLQGSSRTYHAKQLAQEALLEARCVPLVANEIQVNPIASDPFARAAEA